MSSDVAVSDEVNGALLRLCSTSCTDEKILKHARDALKRAALRVREGENEYPAVIATVLARLTSLCERNEWHVKYRLLEVIPLFVKKAEVSVVKVVAKCLDHENWMVRQQAFEALSQLMSKEMNQTHFPSQPGTRTTSRPVSSHKLREPSSPSQPRPRHGLVIGVRKTDSSASSTALKLHQSATQATNTHDQGVPGLNSPGGKPPNVVQADANFDIAAAELFKILDIFIRNADFDVRRLAILAFGKCFPIGDAGAVQAIIKVAHDPAWQCRAAAMLSLREIAITGDIEAQSVVIKSLENTRLEVREAAIKALETIFHKGDKDAQHSIISLFEKANSWSAGDVRCKPWHLIETACKALGVVAESEDDSAILILKLLLHSDQPIEVQRAATYALGCIAERTVPEDMIWTYDNATAQPSKLSTWSNKRWNSREQEYVPNPNAAPLDLKCKHSPRDVLQAITRTPRGGVLPHLLTTPRNEHLYEPGEQVEEALRIREVLKHKMERENKVQDLVLQMEQAMALKDDDEMARLKPLLQKAMAMSPQGVRSPVTGNGSIGVRDHPRLFIQDSFRTKEAVTEATVPDT